MYQKFHIEPDLVISKFAFSQAFLDIRTWHSVLNLVANAMIE